MKYIATIDGESFEIEINTEGEIILNGERLALDFQPVTGQRVYSLLLEGKSYEAYVDPSETEFQVLLRGRLYTVLVEDERQRRLRQASGASLAPGGEYKLKAPMPGLIVDVPAQEGDQVEKGDKLIILESMKMQNELKAPRAGTVRRVQVQTGDSVEQNQLLMILD